MADASSGASSGKVPVVECVAAAWRFMFENWTRFLPAAAIVSVASGIAPLMATAFVGAEYVVTVIASVLFTAVVLRYAVRGEYSAPTGLALGADEARLIGVLGATALVYAPLLFVLLIAWGVSLLNSLGLTAEEIEALSRNPEEFNQAVAKAMAAPPSPTLVVIGVIAFVVLAYLATRLFLVNAATIGERRAVFFQTWSWSKGNVLHIFAAIFLTALPSVLVSLIVGSILSGVAFQEAGSPAGAITVIVVGTVVSLISTLLSIPQIVLGAHLYKGLRPPDFVAK